MSENVVGKATLEVATDASGVKTGMAEAKDSVKDFAAAAKQAGSDAAKGLEQVSVKATEAYKQADSATKRFMTSLEREAQMVGKTKSEWLAFNAEKKGVSDWAAPYVAQIKKAEEANKGYISSAKQQAAAMRTLPAQFTDIATQLAGGQNPMLILLQQGGQIKDSFGGVVPALSAVAAAINPVTLAAGALAVAGGALAYEWYKASESLDSFKNIMLVTGGYAGVTEKQFEDMARSISATAGGSLNSAKEVINQIALDGKLSGDTIGKLSEAAQIYAELTGGKASDAAKNFAKAMEDPKKGAIDLNEQLHFLTLKQYEEIAAAQQMGDMMKAQGLLADALAGKFEKLSENIGFWSKVSGGFSQYAEDLFSGKLNVLQALTLQPPTPEKSELTKAQEMLIQLRENQKKYAGTRQGDVYAQQIVEQSAKVKALQAKRDAEDTEEKKKKEDAQKVADAARVQQEGITAESRYQAFLKGFATPKEKREKEIAEQMRDFDKMSAAGKTVTQAMRDDAVKKINEKYKDAKPKSDPVENAYAREMLSLSKDIAKANQDILNAQSGRLSIDGQHLAKVKEWIENDKEGKKLGEDQKKNLMERAQIADQISVKSQLEIEYIKLKSDAERSHLAVLRDIESIQKNGVASRFNAANDFLNSDRAKTLKLYDGEQGTNQFGEALKLYKQRDSDSAKLAATQYASVIDDQNKALQRQIELLGKTTEEAEKLQAVWQLEDDFKKQTAGMDEANPEALIQAKIKLEEAKAAAINAVDQKRAFDRDPYAQQVVALRNYADEATNMGKQIADAWTSAFSGMEDALTNFVMTGKLDFKSFANSVISDIVRMTIRSQITGPLAKSLSGGSSGLGLLSGIASLFGGGGATSAGMTWESGMENMVWSAPGRAVGGSVDSGSLYQVNERGPELLTVGGRDYLMMGSKSGNITPNSKLGGNTVHVTIQQSFASGTDRRTTDQAALQASNAIRRAQTRNG